MRGLGLVFALSAVVAALGLLGLAGGAFAALPDGRAYELVSPLQTNGVSPYAAVPSLSGVTVDFQARGAFAGAASGSLNLYQSVRTGAGWQTAPLTPAPTTALGPLEEQAPVWFSPDLSQTIFTTPESYTSGDEDGGALDLYMRSAGGALTWLSQGAQGGTAPKQVTFDGATPDGGNVVFSTGESLLPSATALEALFPEPQYLYDRVLAGGQTNLVNVNGAGELLNGAGAVLGNGTHLASGPPPAGDEYLPADVTGTTTNAISRDGSKIFFESPPPGTVLPLHGGEEVPVGLYMREGAGQTVKIAESGGEKEGASNGVRYEGASADGSLVFFTSGKSLGGAAADRQLYEFNTTSNPIGGAPPLSAIPISEGLGGDRTPATTLSADAHEGETTIAVASTVGFNVGESIDFGVGKVHTVIAAVPDSTHLELTSIVLGNPGSGEQVVGEQRTASVSAIAGDGSHVYFVAAGVLATNANSQGAHATVLKPNLYVYDTENGETTFIATLAKKDVTAEGGGPGGLVAEPDISRPAVPTPDGGVLAFASAANLTGQNPAERFTEIYRYALAGETLECVSCTAPGVQPTGNADFGETAGGTYDPPGLSSPIGEDGERIFFDTPDSLVLEDGNGGSPPSALFGAPTSTDVYEWEGGKVSLVSGGGGGGPAVLQGTTPSGSDVLFTSGASLVPGQGTGGYAAVYDARVGGGFPAQAAGPQPCAAGGCRGAFSSPPAFAAPGSASTAGPGNLPAPVAPVVKPKAKKVVCRKGFVKKRVKGKEVCVRKKKAAKAGRARRGRS